jgi:hypothetical protein
MIALISIHSKPNVILIYFVLWVIILIYYNFIHINFNDFSFDKRFKKNTNYTKFDKCKVGGNYYISLYLFQIFFFT